MEVFSYNSLALWWVNCAVSVDGDAPSFGDSGAGFGLDGLSGDFDMKTAIGIFDELLCSIDEIVGSGVAGKR